MEKGPVCACRQTRHIAQATAQAAGYVAAEAAMDAQLIVEDGASRIVELSTLGWCAARGRHVLATSARWLAVATASAAIAPQRQKADGPGWQRRVRGDPSVSGRLAGVRVRRLDRL